MAVVKRTEKENGVVECLIDSSNILLSEYNKLKYIEISIIIIPRNILEIINECLVIII